MTETRILLIRHAESMPDPNQPEPSWPLSEHGERQAQALVDTLVDDEISAIYSSPYPRATATVQPLSNARTIATAIREELRERKLTEVRSDDRRELIARSWRDFDFALPGCESANDVQKRTRASLNRIAHDHQGETVVACSHGNAIALFLNSIDATFGFDQWAEMKNPHIYRLGYSGGDWSWRDDA
jgi:2,3-bisphosphoglycerate-dependent phosphoglycerate mutase